MSDPDRILEALQEGRIRRVCMIRASRLGDLLFTLPVLDAFHKRHPGARITFLTNPSGAPLLETHEAVSDLRVLDFRDGRLRGRKGKEAARVLRNDGIELCCPLRPRSSFGEFAKAAGCAFLWPPPKDPPGDRSRHVVRQGLDRFLPLGLPPEAEPPIRVRLRDFEREEAGSFCGDGETPIVLHPGCDETLGFRLRRGVRRRVWPVEHWRALLALCGKEGLPVIVSSGGPGESRWVRRLLAGVRSPFRHVAGLPIRRFAALLDRAGVVVSGDTGPLHLATAVGTPVIGLYGPSPESYTGPWHPGSPAVVLRRALPCSPCQGKHVHCPANVCMEEIRPEEVFRTIRETLDRTLG